ncbi:hypothetical protein BY996DRAFT_6614273 [Phakopsora pachyrhizi]|nr:hypothetical protein BY996DRAFT_6614273 [Phakopsora pachyrhizi]
MTVLIDGKLEDPLIKDKKVSLLGRVICGQKISMGSVSEGSSCPEEHEYLMSITCLSTEAAGDQDRRVDIVGSGVPRLRQVRQLIEGGWEMRERNVVSVETDLVNTKPLETKTGGRILLRDEMVETVLIGETNVALVATDVMKTKPLETKTGGRILLRDEMVETFWIGRARQSFEGGKVMRETNVASPLETKTGGRILLRDEMVETVLIGLGNHKFVIGFVLKEEVKSTEMGEKVDMMSILTHLNTDLVNTKPLETKTGGLRQARQLIEGGKVMRETNVALVATDVMKTKPLETKTGGRILLRDEMPLKTKTGGRILLRDEMVETFWIVERNMEYVETDMVNTKLLETKTGGWILLRDEMVVNYNNMNNDKEADGDDVKEDGERSFKDFYNVNEEDSESNSSSTSSEHGQTNRFDANSETSSEFKSEEYIFQESESGLHRNPSCYYPFKNNEVSTYVSNNNS